MDLLSRDQYSRRWQYGRRICARPPQFRPTGSPSRLALVPQGDPQRGKRAPRPNLETRGHMPSIRTAIGITAVALLSMAATTAAGSGWASGQSASTGNLYDPSMVEDSKGHEHVVARGDTGVWYITDKSGSFVRTRMTQDAFHKTAVNPLIAIASERNADRRLRSRKDIRVERLRSRPSFATRSERAAPGPTPGASRAPIARSPPAWWCAATRSTSPPTTRTPATARPASRTPPTPPAPWTHTVVASGLSNGTTYQLRIADHVRRQADARLHQAEPPDLRAEA